MKKGKKIVIGVAAVAVVAGGVYAVAGGSRGESTDSSGFSYKGGNRRCGRNRGRNRNGGQ
ncbi:MAG: hypothetical protein ACLTQN_07885 [Blautia massiliensis (ex Durand et al. 2017)]